MAKFKTGLSISTEKKEIWTGTKLDNNECLVDTSGFVPLDIRLKKIDIASAQRKLALAQFDYHETAELYDDDEIFSKYDSLEELQSKIDSFNSKKQAYLQSKAVEFANIMRAKESAKTVNNAENKPQTTPIQANSNNNTTTA